MKTTSTSGGGGHSTIFLMRSDVAGTRAAYTNCSPAFVNSSTQRSSHHSAAEYRRRVVRIGGFVCERRRLGARARSLRAPLAVWMRSGARRRLALLGQYRQNPN